MGTFVNAAVTQRTVKFMYNFSIQTVQIIHGADESTYFALGTIVVYYNGFLRLLFNARHKNALY